MFNIIAFDGDDTLWHNEGLFSFTQEKFRALLANYCEPEFVDKRLYETEVKNLEIFGYGVKGFMLSMIETAIELTEGQIKGSEIQQMIDFGRVMLEAPTELLDGVERVIRTLSEQYPLMIITKGDLLDQETKIAQSGIADLFRHIEIVSYKTEQSYQQVFAKYDIQPERFLMVGNSLKSDVLPIVKLGGVGVHIEYHKTWAHEQVTEVTKDGYYELESIQQLPAFIETLAQERSG